MPSTLNGTGTHFYGDRERDVGGTYVTTKWVVLFWVPLIPLSSWRVYMLDDARVDYIIDESSRTSQAMQATQVPLNWKQVLNVYLVTIPLVLAAWYILHQLLPGLF
jgi:hypothetical protein